VAVRLNLNLKRKDVLGALGIFGRIVFKVNLKVKDSKRQGTS
jgi:hypothetical protein